jgi:solute carrier family 25 phosphate transporter 3
MSYRSNPFFSTTSTFFLPSVGDKVDQAIGQGKDLARDAQNKGESLLNKADNKVQDAKEAVKTAAKQPPTGVDLYAR